MSKLRIYALVCPFTYEIRYVGKTKLTLKKRLSAHIRYKSNNNASKKYWIENLKKRNSNPLIILLEITDNLNDKELEKKWIKTCLDEKCDLFNVNLI